MNICTVDNCGRSIHAVGLCHMHYLRMRRHGDTNKNLPGLTHGHNMGRLMSPTYRSWAGMIQRCINPKRSSYKNYGALGICVHESWKRFENFLTEMGIRPEGKTLDRINNDGNYEPGNCRWVTRSEQQRNKRPMSNETKEKHRQARLKTFGQGR